MSEMILENNPSSLGQTRPEQDDLISQEISEPMYLSIKTVTSKGSQRISPNQDEEITSFVQVRYYTYWSNSQNKNIKDTSNERFITRVYLSI